MIKATRHAFFIASLRQNLIKNTITKPFLTCWLHLSNLISETFFLILQTCGTNFGNKLTLTEITLDEFQTINNLITFRLKCLKEMVLRQNHPWQHPKIRSYLVMVSSHRPFSSVLGRWRPHSHCHWMHPGPICNQIKWDGEDIPHMMYHLWDPPSSCRKGIPGWLASDSASWDARCNSENIHFRVYTYIFAFVPRDAKMYPWV